MPFFQISLINSQLKTTHNTFRTLSDNLSRNSYIMPITRPYSLWNMRNYMYLWILKSYSVVSKKYSPHAVFQTLQTRKNDLSKTFRLTSLQKPTLQPVQSSVSLSICAFFCISCAIYFFSVWAVIFMFHSIWGHVPNVWIWHILFEAWLWRWALKRPVLVIFIASILTKSYNNLKWK